MANANTPPATGPATGAGQTAPVAPLRLPGTALAALYVGFCLVPPGLAVGRQVAPADPWELAAAALGLIGLGAMAVQFVTSGRFEAASGQLGIDKIMAFHKIAAWWVLLAVVLHPLLYVLPTWAESRPLGAERFMAYLTLPHYRTGVVAWGALVALIGAAVLRQRLPWRYETWRAGHIVLGPVALGFGLHHALSTGRFSAAPPVQTLWIMVAVAVACVLAVLYGLRWWTLHRRPWTLRAIHRLADRMWELDIQPGPQTPALPYQAGQFVWMSQGARRFPLFDHPFSIADSPRRAGLSLIIKEAGDFTDKVGTLCPGTPIGIDGPHGDFVLEGHDAGAVVLIAGGVGIAPVMGLLRDLVERRDPRPVRLAYAVGTPANFACLDEIEAARQVLDLDTMLLSEDAAAGWRGDVGRLDRPRLQTLLSGLDPEATVAMICGPGPMITAVSDTLLDLGLPMRRVIYERFDYAAGAASRLDRRRTLNFLGVGATLGLAVALFVAVEV